MKQEAKDPLVVTGTSDQSKLELRTQVSCDWSVVSWQPILTSDWSTHQY